MKKIAIPTQNGQVDHHFGHCNHYTVYTVSDVNEIVKTERVESPQGCGCKSDIAATLKADGVSVMLAGNIGQGAINKLAQSGIEVTRGCTGATDAVIADFLGGKIADSGETCNHHHDSSNGFSLADDDHVCGNH